MDGVLARLGGYNEHQYWWLLNHRDLLLTVQKAGIVGSVLGRAAHVPLCPQQGRRGEKRHLFHKGPDPIWEASTLVTLLGLKAHFLNPAPWVFIQTHTNLDQQEAGGQDPGG